MTNQFTSWSTDLAWASAIVVGNPELAVTPGYEVLVDRRRKYVS